MNTQEQQGALCRRTVKMPLICNKEEGLSPLCCRTVGKFRQDLHVFEEAIIFKLICAFYFEYLSTFHSKYFRTFDSSPSPLRFILLSMVQPTSIQTLYATVSIGTSKRHHFTLHICEEHPWIPLPSLHRVTSRLRYFSNLVLIYGEVECLHFIY